MYCRLSVGEASRYNEGFFGLMAKDYQAMQKW